MKNSTNHNESTYVASRHNAEKIISFMKSAKMVARNSRLVPYSCCLADDAVSFYSLALKPIIHKLVCAFCMWLINHLSLFDGSHMTLMVQPICSL